MRFLLLLTFVTWAHATTNTDGLFVKVTETSTTALTETFTPYCVVSVGTACSSGKRRRRRAAILAALPDGFDDVSYNALHERVRRSVTQPEALETSQEDATAAAAAGKEGRIVPLFTLTYTSFLTQTQYVVTDTQTISASPSCDLTDLAVPTCGTAYTVSTFTATQFTGTTSTSTVIDTSYVNTMSTISYTNTHVDEQTATYPFITYSSIQTYSVTANSWSYSTSTFFNYADTVTTTLVQTETSIHETTLVVTVVSATDSTVIVSTIF